MSAFNDLKQAVRRHNQQEWECKVALWEARTKERIGWAELAQTAQISRSTAINWVKEVEEVMAGRLSAPEYLLVDLSKLPPDIQQIVKDSQGN